MSVRVLKLYNIPFIGNVPHQRSICTILHKHTPGETQRKCIPNVFPAFRQHPYPIQKFHTSSVNQNQRKRVETKVVMLQNPFKYISLRIKLFLMKAYFDHEFNEEQFMIGAKQGVIYVSSRLSEGKLEELNDVLTQEGMQACRKLYLRHSAHAPSLRVDESDFLSMSLNDIGFEYDEGGRKWAYILVVSFCTAKDVFTKTIGNIDIIATPTRMLKLSFRREYTPGTTSSWLVDALEYTKTPLSSMD